MAADSAVVVARVVQVVGATPGKNKKRETKYIELAS
jgi:hypothetical protein